jgi:hypothetical protein
MTQFGLNFPMPTGDPMTPTGGVTQRMDQGGQMGGAPGLTDASLQTPGGPVQLPTASAQPPSSLAGGADPSGMMQTAPPGAAGAPLAQASPLAPGPVAGAGQPQPPDVPGMSPAAGFQSPFGRSL